MPYERHFVLNTNEVVIDHESYYSFVSYSRE